MEIHVWAQHTNQAGQRCWDESRWDGNDTDLYEGDTDYLQALASEMEAAVEVGAYGAGTDLFKLRTARTLREALRAD